MKDKLRLIRAVSVQNIVIEWVIHTILTFLLKRLKGRLRGKTHFRYYFLLTVGKQLMSNYFDLILSARYVEKDKLIPVFPSLVESTLRMHKVFHKYRVGTESCQFCNIIKKHKGFLEQFTSNPKLYPPFKFSKKK